MANGKLLVILKGEEEKPEIKSMITKALVGEPIISPSANYTKPLESSIKSIRSTMKTLAPYWSCLRFGDKKLPKDMSYLKKQKEYN